MADLQDHLYVAPTPIGIPADTTDAPDGLAEAPTPAETDIERARVLLAAQLVVDGHNTLAQELDRTHWHDLQHGSAFLDTDIPRIRAGGVGAQFWSLHVPPGPGAVQETLDRIDAVRTLIASCPEALRLALTAADMVQARDCGRIASLLGPVSGAALGDSLGTLRAYHALGVRSLSLAGTGWTADPAGLTPFGEETIREMNRLGVIADLTGSSGATMERVLDLSKAPVVLSHSAARALTPHADNAPDDVLRRLAANRGVCMVSFAPDQVTRRADQPATLWDVADHVEHVREVAGPQCVGLAGSYGMSNDAPHTVGLEDASCYPNLIAELLRRDWAEADVAALTWGNAARVVREAADAAQPAP
ncbi:dipeptidase [Streptomyces sp. NPDC015131]|uniref:dipeptidase n=1 Tax=Streptomyces sp. NPDC015131 TaxID=3364941 RepID=UPI0036F51027